MKEKSLKESIKLVREILNQKPVGKSVGLKQGNICMYKYMAKDQSKRYDKTPLVIILRKTKTHTLGLNLHWCPFGIRKMVMNYIIKLNGKNIREGKSLEVSYNLLKPFIKKMQLTKVVRKYINTNISRGIQLIPLENIKEIIELRAETFTGGISASSLYNLAKKGKI